VRYLNVLKKQARQVFQLRLSLYATTKKQFIQVDANADKAVP